MTFFTVHKVLAFVKFIEIFSWNLLHSNLFPSKLVFIIHLNAHAQLLCLYAFQSRFSLSRLKVNIIAYILIWGFLFLSQQLFSSWFPLNPAQCSALWFSSFHHPILIFQPQFLLPFVRIQVLFQQKFNLDL